MTRFSFSAVPGMTKMQHPTQNCKQLFGKTCLIRQAQLTAESRIKSEVTSFKLQVRNKSHLSEGYTSISNAVLEYIPSEYSFMLLIKPVCSPKLTFLPAQIHHNILPTEQVSGTIQPFMATGVHHSTCSSSFTDAVSLMNAGFLQIVRHSNGATI